MTRLILASTSPYRQALLKQLGLPFEAHAPGVDEAPYKAKGLPPEELTKILARAKAEALAERFPDALILGGDQVAALDDTILGKPGTPEKACAQLRQMAGRSHHLWSALALHDARTGNTEAIVEHHVMTMRALTEAQIADYVARDNPVDCAGSYKVESLGMALFSAIEGCDHTAIVGLPLIHVTTLLARCGVDVLG